MLSSHTGGTDHIGGVDTSKSVFGVTGDSPAERNPELYIWTREQAME
jgi:hypothetical protein